MPSAPLRYCAEPGCPEKVTQGRCGTHTSQNSQRRLHELGHRLYGTARWHRLRDLVRREEPFCRVHGCERLTEHVDHVRPHRGDLGLFFDRYNLQGLCVTHHSEKTARGE